MDGTLGMPKTLDETLVTGLVWGWGTARWDRGAYIVAVHAELPSELHPEIIQLFRAEAAHLSRASPLLDSGGDRSELAVSRFLGMSFEMLTGPSPTPRTHILARIAAGSGTHDVAMMKASPKKTMAAYVADGEVERRAPPPRPTTATGGSRGGLGAFAHRPGSAPSSAGASPIKGAHAARRVHPSALASPVRATAAGAAASKKANDQRRREEGRRSINERTASTRAGVKAKVVTRHAPPTQAQSHAVTTLWDKISGACDNVTQALEECAKVLDFNLLEKKEPQAPHLELGELQRCIQRGALDAGARYTHVPLYMSCALHFRRPPPSQGRVLGSRAQGWRERAQGQSWRGGVMRREPTPCMWHRGCR